MNPRDIAERSGFSYHAILRAIRRGELWAFEPVAGHYRISISEYERWLTRLSPPDTNAATGTLPHTPTPRAIRFPAAL